MDNKIEPNASAFPLADEAAGLTKREYFAGLVMQGLCTKYGYISDSEIKKTAL